MKHGHRGCRLDPDWANWEGEAVSPLQERSGNTILATVSRSTGTADTNRTQTNVIRFGLVVRSLVHVEDPIANRVGGTSCNKHKMLVYNDLYTPGEAIGISPHHRWMVGCPPWCWYEDSNGTAT